MMMMMAVVEALVAPSHYYDFPMFIYTRIGQQVRGPRNQRCLLVVVQ